MRAGAWISGIAILVTSASACKVATVRRLDENADQTQAQAPGAPFDATKLVDSIWSTEVLRALETAPDIAALDRGTTAPAAASQDGTRSIVVRGQGRVVEVDTRSRSGFATIELRGTAGSMVVIQVGPVLTGTAIRDAFPSLGFDRFVNQIQHADVANELNSRIEKGLLLKLDRARLRGRQVSFAGMASFEVGRPVTLTPVRLELEEGL
jgi:predicted lipoprotein